MAEGWVKVYRNLMGSFVWTNPYQLKLWMLLLMKARHEPGKVIFNGREQLLNSGQIITGRAALTLEMNEGVRPAHKVNSSFLNRALKKFEEAGMLNIKSTTKYSVITITNWTAYQKNEQIVNSNRTGTEQLSNTNKNVKNVRIKEVNTTTSEVQESPFTFFQQNGFGQISGFIGEDIQQWLGDFIKAGATEQEANSIMIRAMKIAIERNKANWGYVKAILKDWDNRKLISIQAIEVDQASFEAKQRQRQAKPNQWQNANRGVPAKRRPHIDLGY